MQQRWGTLLFLVLLARSAFGQEDGDGSMGIPGGEVDENIAPEGPAVSPEQLHKMHKMIDSDGDGKMSLLEILAFAHTTGRAISTKDIASVIETADTSKDGKLSLEEHLGLFGSEQEPEDEEVRDRTEQQRKVETAKFMAADGNRDGFLDETELVSLVHPETHDDVLSIVAKDGLRQKDADEDGMLSFDEFFAHGLPEDEGGPSGEEVEEQQIHFDKLDKNGDGYISLDEFKAWEAGIFHTQESVMTILNISDRDGDGHVTAEELAGSHEHLATSDAIHHLTSWAEHHEL